MLVLGKFLMSVFHVGLGGRQTAGLGTPSFHLTVFLVTVSLCHQ